jgi:hypothetical protein
MSPDLTDLISKVIERAIGKYGERYGQPLTMPAMANLGSQDETLLVDSLASQLLTLFDSNVSPPGAATQQNTQEMEPPRADPELIDRNRRLARALGACECWGEQGECKMCFGQGSPGWALPFKPLFDQMVRPAMQTVNAHRLALKRNGGH